MDSQRAIHTSTSWANCRVFLWVFGREMAVLQRAYTTFGVMNMMNSPCTRPVLSRLLPPKNTGHLTFARAGSVFTNIRQIYKSFKKYDIYNKQSYNVLKIAIGIQCTQMHVAQIISYTKDWFKLRNVFDSGHGTKTLIMSHDLHCR